MVCGRKAVVELTGVPGRQEDCGATTGVVRPAVKSAAGNQPCPGGRYPPGPWPLEASNLGKPTPSLNNWVNGWLVAIGS